MHSMLWKNLCGWCLAVFLVWGLPSLRLAQELEPRRWSHLPMNANFVGGGYAYTEADIFFDPLLKLEDVEMEMKTYAVQYIRTFELLQKSARIDFAQGYQEGRWTGLVNGVPASPKRSGFSDSFLRFAVNLYGSPPLKEKEFAAYRTLQSHLIYNFRPGIWEAASAGYGYGGESAKSKSLTSAIYV